MTVQRLASTEFRRRYPRLDGPVEVTALGRVIGTWMPAARHAGAVGTPATVSGREPGSETALTGQGAARVDRKAADGVYTALRKVQRG